MTVCIRGISWLLYLYRAAPLGIQTADTVNLYPTQSHYPDSRSGALKAANLQQCMGTAEGSHMWLEVGLGRGRGSSNRSRGRSREEQGWGAESRGTTPVFYEGMGRLASVVLCPSKTPGHTGMGTDL